MFKFILLCSALVLSASAFPAETEEQSGNFFTKMYNGNLETRQKMVDLVKNSVSKATGLGSDAMSVAQHLAKTGTNAGITLGLKGVYEGVDLANRATDIAQEFTQHIPVVNKGVEMGAGVAKMGLAAGLNAAATAMNTAKNVANKGIDVATGLTQNTLDAVDKSTSVGTNWYKKGLEYFKLKQ